MQFGTEVENLSVIPKAAVDPVREGIEDVDLYIDL